MDGAYMGSDEDYASSVNQRQRWPGTTPHQGGLMRGGPSQGTLSTAVPPRNQLSRQASDTSTVEGV